MRDDFFKFLLGLALAIAHQIASAQLPGVLPRPLNIGLIGGIVVDANGRAQPNATVHLEQVAADVSECSLRIYGPNKGANAPVTATSNGTFLIAFEWEPEQIGCVLGGPTPQALVIALAFDANNDYRKGVKQFNLMLAPNLTGMLNGIKLQATGSMSEQLNKRIKEAVKNNPALEVYLRALSQVMSVEMYGLMGDAGTVVIAQRR